MATEKLLDLIDRNAAIRKLEDEMFLCEPVSIDDGYIDAYKKRLIPKLLRNVIDWLQDQPSVDAVEVVHGRWEKDPDMRRMNGHIYDYRCSHCHSPAEKGYYNNNDKFTNYCPNCGARMDQ